MKILEDTIAGVVTDLFKAFAVGSALWLASVIVYTYWLPDMPRLGYWPAVLIAVCLRAMVVFLSDEPDTPGRGAS